SGGIGGAIAAALHAQGATVGLSGTKLPALEALAGRLGERALILPADLADPAAGDKLIADAESSLGQVDILVNNAGLTRDTIAIRLSDEDWQKVLDVNLTAGFRLARACLRTMMRRRWGRIIGIGSVVGHTGNPGQANYAAAKAAMVGMSKALAAEVASRNVTVNVVSPGFITTAMTEVLSDSIKQRLLEMIPSKRMGRPEEVAAAVVYLASEEAAYMTGQTLHVNGGMAMI
ncbi:MAG TPA: 3-oxoacyl-ACP reductase FabG, partial [Dongiaceae bacterium]|nr:3-oxoacyl-ACP reductase FabG [Dongiaceae bacterium]